MMRRDRPRPKPGPPPGPIPMGLHTEIRKDYLETMRIATRKMLADAEIALAIDVHAMQSDMMRATVYEFVAWFAADRIETMTFRTWASSWDCIKDRWAPAWFKERWPVKWVTTKFSTMAGYPGYRVEHKELGRPILFYEVEVKDSDGRSIANSSAGVDYWEGA